MPKYYKVVRSDGSPIHGDSRFKYSFPVNGKPGAWHSVDYVRMCYKGFHVTDRAHINEWAAEGRKLYEVEVAGKREHGDDKSVFQKMRFTKFLGVIKNPYGDTINEILGIRDLRAERLKRFKKAVAKAEEIVNYRTREAKYWERSVVQLKAAITRQEKCAANLRKKAAEARRGVLAAKKALAKAKAKK